MNKIVKGYNKNTMIKGRLYYKRTKKSQNLKK